MGRHEQRSQDCANERVLAGHAWMTEDGEAAGLVNLVRVGGRILITDPEPGRQMVAAGTVLQTVLQALRCHPPDGGIRFLACFERAGI